MAFLFLASATLVWLVSDWVSARIAPPASAEMKQAGQELFVHQWVAHDPQAHGDGLGPMFNANSCVACHFQGGVGGGGDIAHNVVAYEVHPTVHDRQLQKGLLHAFAVDKSLAESHALLKTCFPIIKGGDRVVGGCTVRFEDFDPVRIETTNSIALFGDGLIDQVRLERAGADAIIRVSFDGTPGEMRTSALTDPPRLVLDFHRPVTEAIGERSERAAPLRMIVLDAGHGGHDPGATGPSGLAEKDLVLDVTRRVAKLVEAELGVRILLTRSDDTFVTLRDRTSIANRERADLFVSIHGNAHRQIDSAGVETYFLSSEATDSGARQAAAVENSVVQLENPAGGRGRADIVKAILWDLAQSEFQAESSRLAEIVQDSMTRSLRIPNRGVKQAGFYVLGGAAMPAILVEIGFVTNPREERRLRESRYRDEIARAILAGLAEYKRYWDQRMRTTADRAR